jgi:hypothetical protein
MNKQKVQSKQQVSRYVIMDIANASKHCNKLQMQNKTKVAKYSSQVT